MVGERSAHAILFEEVVVGDHLLVAGHPVAEAKEEDGRVVKDAYDSLGEALVVHWGQTVGVEKHSLLHKVEDQDGHGSDREQDRDAEAIGHGDKDNVEQARVLEVHHVDRASVGVDVCLDARLPRHVRISGEATVEEPGEETEAEEAESLKNWEHGSEDHGAHECVSDHLEPAGVEVRLATSSETEGEWLLTQVGIDKQE